MAENVVKIPETENATGNEKLVRFLTNYKVALIALLGTIVIAIAGYVVVYSVGSKGVNKGLDKIEYIQYQFTKDASSLSEADFTERADAALRSLEGLLSKGGIVGARANMLAADIYGQKKDFVQAKDLWLTAAAKGKGSYVAPLCKFEAAVCADEIQSNSDEALALYEEAAADVNFPARSRAYFNAGRIKEAKGDFNGAKAAYDAIANLELSNDPWSDNAKSRIIALKIEGKIE